MDLSLLKTKIHFFNSNRHATKKRSKCDKYIISKNKFYNLVPTSVTVTINDTKWYNEYQDLVKALPNDFPPISTISDSITIRVMFSEVNILVIALIVT